MRIKSLSRRTYLDRNFVKQKDKKIVSVTFTHDGRVINEKTHKASIYEHRMTHELWAFETDAYYKLTETESGLALYLPESTHRKVRIPNGQTRSHNSVHQR